MLVERKSNFVTCFFVLLLFVASVYVNASPVISGITSSASASKYLKYEITFNVKTVSTVPYWPYDETPNTGVPAKVGISVDGYFLPPGVTDWNNAIIQPAFYYQEYQYDSSNPLLKIEDGSRWIYPVGNPVWKIRFSPNIVGAWKYKIRARDASGVIDSAITEFQCQESNKHGFMVVSKRDPRYFELSDGTYIPLIGISDVDTDKYSQLKEMGVNYVRSWWQSSWPTLALFGAGGQGGDLNWPHLNYTTQYVQSPNIVITTVPNKVDPWDTINRYVAVKQNTKYRLSAMVKTVGLTGAGDYGLFLGDEIAGTKSTRLKGDNDWKEISLDIDSGDRIYVRIYIGQQYVSSGVSYLKSISMKEVFGDGTYGLELLPRNDFQAHKSYSQPIALTIDRLLDSAEQNNIYVKAVIEEKGDDFFGRIQSNGTWGERSDDNVYADPQHACRTYQTYYWRYLIARYSYSTALQGVELFNEADPNSTSHAEAVAALGEYFDSNDPNHHLVSTSNWHSFPITMWNQPEVDNADMHIYMGWNVPAGGNRLIPGWDGNSSYTNNSNSIDYGPTFSIDNNIAHTGTRSLKMTLPTTSDTVNGSANLTMSYAWFVCSARKGDQIRLSYWAKTQSYNPFSYAVWKKAGVALQYAKYGGDFSGYTEQDPGITISSGTNDWKYYESTWTVVNPDANHLWVQLYHWGNGSTSVPGTIWLDDLEIRNLNTGNQLNYNGGFEYQTPQSFDVVAGHCAYSRILAGYHLNKPVVRGEVGFTSPKRFTDPYKGFTFNSDGGIGGEDQYLVDDTQGVWWRKWVWAQTDPGALYEIYWWTNLLITRGFNYALAYQNFMADIPLSNGNYKDINAIVSTQNLRVLGQKDVVNGKAFFFADNVNHTWKAVVDSTVVAPVTGAITISGMPQGAYNVQWWDTSTGTIVKQETVNNTTGNIMLNVTNLQSDIACKISSPTEIGPVTGSADIDMRVFVDSNAIIPGQIVVVTVEYTNTGNVAIPTAVITSQIPAEMDYVLGSAETNGGVYNSIKRTVSWTIQNIPSGQKSTKTFKARVR